MTHRKHIGKVTSCEGGQPFIGRGSARPVVRFLLGVYLGDVLDVVLVTTIGVRPAYSVWCTVLWDVGGHRVSGAGGVLGKEAE